MPSLMNIQEAERPLHMHKQSRTKYDHGWRRIIRNFSPSWFSVTMGTGIVATLLISIPFKSRWLYYLSIIVFILNTFLFALAVAISFLRYVLYPEIWFVMIDDPVNSLFLGTVPMGLATLIEMWVFVCVPAWKSEWVRYFGWIAWMFDVVLAVTITVFLTFRLMSRDHGTSLENITAAQLLPIAATIVAAGTGAEVAEILTSPHKALGTIIACLILVGMSIPLAFVVLTLYYQRLALHKLPPREVIVSCFLPLGPLSFGGYTVMYLGKVARYTLPATEALHPLAGDTFYIIGFLIALVLWGFAVVWLILALAAIHRARPFPFNMGWWGFVFPLGVFSVSAIQIGNELTSKFFKIVGTVLAVAVVLLWIIVAVWTIQGAWNGRLFHAPCLANLHQESEELIMTLETNKSSNGGVVTNAEPGTATS